MDTRERQSLPPVGVVQRNEITNPLSGTRTTVYFSGATFIDIGFYNYGSAVAKEARVVFNAIDDADADARAISPGNRVVVPIGTRSTIPFDESFKCTRMDIYSDVAAETGSSKVVYESVSP